MLAVLCREIAGIVEYQKSGLGNKREKEKGEFPLIPEKQGVVFRLDG